MNGQTHTRGPTTKVRTPSRIHPHIHVYVPWLTLLYSSRLGDDLLGVCLGPGRISPHLLRVLWPDPEQYPSHRLCQCALRHVAVSERNGPYASFVRHFAFRPSSLMSPGRPYRTRECHLNGPSTVFFTRLIMWCSPMSMPMVATSQLTSSRLSSWGISARCSVKEGRRMVSLTAALVTD
jgi:hypothetical protein